MAYGVVRWQNVDAIEIADVLRSATGEILRLVVWGGVVILSRS